jgi:competence protein ComFC
MKRQSRLKKIYDWILDLIFPRFCLNCDKEGIWLCPECSKLIPVYNRKRCVICNQKTIGFLCNQCRETTGIDYLTILTHYDHPLVSSLIHTYKYQFVQEISMIIAQLIWKRIKSIDFRSFVIVPVPLHYKRFRWREFNQAELISKQLGHYLEIKVNQKLLKRVKDTKPQAGIANAKERRANVADAFKINPKEQLPSKVILLDDVGTTFGTLTECAKILKKGGVKEILAIVFAKG